MFQPLKSSNLKGFDYDEKMKQLDVTFNNGKTYRYENVDANVISGLQFAPSHGKFFHQSIAKQFKYSVLNEK